MNWIHKRVTMRDGACIELFPERDVAEITVPTQHFTMSMREYLMIVEAVKEMGVYEHPRNPLYSGLPACPARPDRCHGNGMP